VRFTEFLAEHLGEIEDTSLNDEFSPWVDDPAQLVLTGRVQWGASGDKVVFTIAWSNLDDEIVRAAGEMRARFAEAAGVPTYLGSPGRSPGRS